MKKFMFFIYILCLASKSLYAYPQRIVSTTVASDEILVKLLEDGNDIKRLVAVSKFALSPEYSHLTSLPAHIKNEATNNVEFIAKIKPDLVIITSFSNPSKKLMLQRLRIPFYEMQSFDNITDIEKEIVSIGEKIGKKQKAKKVVEDMKKRLKALTLPKKKYTVLNYSSSSSLLGAKTLFNDMVVKAGAVNLATEKGIVRWKKVSDEYLLTLNPDYIVMSKEEKSHLSAAWRDKKAMKQSNIIKLSSKDLLSTSQYIVDAVEKLNAGFFSRNEKK